MILVFSHAQKLYSQSSIVKSRDWKNHLKNNYSQSLKHLAPDFNYESSIPGFEFHNREQLLLGTNRSVTAGLYKEDVNANNSDIFGMLDVSYKAGYLREIEELYSTNSLYQNFKIGKRFSDLFKLNVLEDIEYAKRTQFGKDDVRRWFDNTSLNVELDFNEYNTLSLFGAGSISDTTFTSYGTSLNSKLDLGKVQIKNNLVLSYDYFYYWNQIAQNYASDNVELNYKNFTLSTGYFFGVVNFNFVDGYDEKARNPNSLFNIGVNYKILDYPVINVGVEYSTRNYKYYSPLYFSPQNRSISGASASMYDKIKDFYLYLGSGARVDNNNVFIWDVDSEVGYDNDNFSISGGLSRYNDPFYTSYNTFLNVTKSF